MRGLTFKLHLSIGFIRKQTNNTKPQTDIQIYRQIYRYTDIQIYRQIYDRYTDIQTDIQIYIFTY